MNEELSTRDRVRRMVREVLENATIIDDEPANVVPPIQPEFERTDFDRDESAKSLITEDDLRGLERHARLRIAENARLTPLAQDVINDKRIELIRKPTRGANVKIRVVALGADHGGFEFKERLKKFLAAQNLQIRDFGTNSTAAVDYPDIAHAVAQAVAQHQADIGIIIDGAGIGSAMTANKINGIRAAACYSIELATNAREHNGANVLTLGSKQNSFDEICEIVTAFLSHELTEARHQKRVDQITAIEKQPPN